MREIRTSFWGSIHGHRIAIHVVSAGVPICGYKPAARMQQQICAMKVYRDYLTCKKCIRIIDRLQGEKKTQ
jgi:hypothetical protein